MAGLIDLTAAAAPTSGWAPAEGGAMGTHRDPAEGGGTAREEVAGNGHQPPQHLHVTLDNLADLAELEVVVPSLSGRANGTARTDGVPTGQGRLPAPAPPRAPSLSPAPSPPRTPAPPPVLVPVQEPAPPAHGTEPARRPGRARPGAEPAPGPRPTWIVPPPAPAPGAGPGRARRFWGRLGERWLLEALALAAASGALVSPSAWLLGTVELCAIGGVVAYAASGQRLGALPGRAARRALVLLRPRSLVWAPVLVARIVIVAVLLPAGVAAVAWLAREGFVGTVAAARAGAWAHGPRVAAFAVCIGLLTSVGDGRQRRAAAVRRWAAPLSDGAVAALAAAGMGVAVLVAVAAPRSSEQWVAGADGLGWLPPAFREQVDQVRDDIVTTELDSVATCLSRRSGAGWHGVYTTGNDLAARDVATLVADRPARSRTPRDLATALLAGHNQLAPWVESIEARWDGQVVRIDRGALPRAEPVVDGERLATAASAGGEWLAGAVPDRAMALRCSAGPVL